MTETRFFSYRELEGQDLQRGTVIVVVPPVLEELLTGETVSRWRIVGEDADGVVCRRES